MNSESAWAQAAQQFQQGFGDQWAKALQSFGGLDVHGAMPAMPKLTFSPAKLQALQEAYLTEAADLWNKGLTASPAAGDKRFASDAWASNPVAGFSAAVYLLNARTLLGLAEAARGLAVPFAVLARAAHVAAVAVDDGEPVFRHGIQAPRLRAAVIFTATVSFEMSTPRLFRVTGTSSRSDMTKRLTPARCANVISTSSVGGCESDTSYWSVVTGPSWVSVTVSAPLMVTPPPAMVSPASVKLAVAVDFAQRDAASSWMTTL